jgi:hypothetical protein
MQVKSKSNFAVKAILSSVLLASISSLAQAGINDGLVVKYTFDNCTATDSSGKNRNGFVMGTPSCVAGKVGKALSFNSDGAQGDYVILPALGAVFGSGFSVCGWVQFSTSPRYRERIIDFGNGEDSDNILFYRTNTDSNLTFATQGTSGVNAGDISANAIANGQWRFYCVTQNVATLTAKMYVIAL